MSITDLQKCRDLPEPGWCARLCQVLLLVGVRRGVTVQLRFLVWPALLAYALWSYTTVRLYLAHVPSQSFAPLPLAVTACLEACMVIVLAIIETLR